MKKRIFCLLTILFSTLSFAGIFVCANESADFSEEKYLFVSDCDTEKDFSEMVNVSLYNIPKAEQDAFYDDFTTLQRTSSEEAYVILPIPYMRSAAVDTYYRRDEVIEDFIFQVSENGQEWKSLTAEREILHEEELKWSHVLYTISEITSGTGWLKIEFPHNPTVWSPVIGKITAELEESRAERIEVQEQSVFAIPRFDSKEYVLSAQVLDQMNLPMDIPIVWELEESAVPWEGISLSADGILTVTSEAYEFWRHDVTLSCPDADLSVEWMFELKKALLGDYNDDFRIDESELTYALSNYRATAPMSENWDEIRLIDIDDNGMIDVYDIAYLAKYQTPPQTEDTEKGDAEGRKDSE